MFDTNKPIIDKTLTLNTSPVDRRNVPLSWVNGYFFCIIVIWPCILLCPVYFEVTIFF